MLKNYFKFAFRNLRSSKMHSVINITGLSVGMAVALLIGLWIRDEYSYDRYNPNYPRIAQVMQHAHLSGSVYTTTAVPMPLAKELRTRYGHAFKQVVLTWWLRDHLLAAGDKKLTEKGRFMEEQGPDLLSLKMLRGSRAGLQEPGSILLAASVAHAIFGDADPTGKPMQIDNRMSVQVSGVYEDLPANSQFKNTKFIAPWQLLVANDASVKGTLTEWRWDGAEIYVQLAAGADPAAVSASIKNADLDHLEGASARAYKPAVFLQPMSRWHLYSAFTEGVNTGGAIQFVRLFGSIAIAVLLLACINFMNLSTARAERRAREIGVRKAIGSLRGQLVLQFFCESLLAAVIALLVSLIWISLALPWFNMLSGKDIAQPWDQYWFWAAALGFCALTGMVAGSYPAFYLSSFQPVKALKGGFRAGGYATRLRKALVVLQCSVSILLIIGTLIVYRQVEFGRDRPVGYEREGLVSAPITTSDLNGKEERLRQALLRTGKVREMTISSSPATRVWQSLSGFDWPGMAPNTQAEFGAIAVTPEYGKTLGWQFAAGRDFSRDYATDSSGLILSEGAVKFMGLRQPVGATLHWNGKPFQVIGVVKDMVMNSPYDPPGQTIYYLSQGQEANFLLLRIQPNVGMRDALAGIRAAFREVAPAAPFDYTFVDQEYAKKFAGEERIGRLTALFSVLAIFISCIGIFGMASFMAEQRIKEIGIRKVLGASVGSLWHLLSGDFVRLAIVAAVIAMPVGWWVMSRWLDNYSYRSPFSWWVFAVAGLGAVLITLLTVSCQAIRAATANPVKSLKTE
jgi:hypothetical protein